jgi:hypothetical protein
MNFPNARSSDLNGIGRRWRWPWSFNSSRAAASSSVCCVSSLPAHGAGSVRLFWPRSLDLTPFRCRLAGLKAVLAFVLPAAQAVPGVARRPLRPADLALDGEVLALRVAELLVRVAIGAAERAAPDARVLRAAPVVVGTSFALPQLRVLLSAVLAGPLLEPVAARERLCSGVSPGSFIPSMERKERAAPSRALSISFSSGESPGTSF